MVIFQRELACFYIKAFENIYLEKMVNKYLNKES